MTTSTNHGSNGSAPSTHEILTSMLQEVGDLSGLLELFYLSREPGVLELLRWVAALPQPERGELTQFIADAGKRNQSIRLNLTAEGALVLEPKA